MNLSIIGKNALVCGGSKGIGRASAIQLASIGANVTLVSRSAEKMTSVIDEMDKSQGQDHDFLIADFSDSQDLRKKIIGLLSIKNYHVLVNNTGGPPGGPIIDARVEEFITAFHNHLICNHLLATLLKDGMIEEGYGRIINIISTSVKIPLDNLGVSNTTRGAVASWSKTMANELGQYGITVNNVLPGFTQTERLSDVISARSKLSGKSEGEIIEAFKKSTPLRRFADPMETGAAVAFLASPEAAYITGVSLPVDGGRTRSL